MKISIIISTYNRPGALIKVLDGLNHQTRMPDEVIVADDGSTPPASELLQQDAQTHLRFPIQFVWHEHRDFRAASIRNKAILTSTGDYIVLLDGDCIPEQHFTADHLHLARKGFFFQGKRLLISQKLTNRFDRSTIGFPLIRYALTGDIGNFHHLIRIPFPSLTNRRMAGVKSCNMGFFREDILAVNGFNENFVGWGREDSELVARFYKYGLKRKEHPFRAICFHLWHPANNRTRMDINERLLRDTIESTTYRCTNGLKRE